MTQLRLQRLRDQVEALRRVTQQSFPSPNEDLPGLLVDLERSLARLQDRGAGPPPVGGDGAPRFARTRKGRLRALADAAPLLVRSMARGASCRWANRSWCEFTGRSPERARGDGWLQDVHVDDRARCARVDAAASDGREFRELEYRLRRASGAFARVREHRVPRFASSGLVTGYLATAVDATPRGRAERPDKAVDATERALARSLSAGGDTVTRKLGPTGVLPTGSEDPAALREAASAETLPHAVLTVDTEGRVRDVDPAARALFGLPPSGASGRAFRDLIGSDAGRQRFRECLEQQVAQAPLRRVARFASPALKADGSSFPARFALTTPAQDQPLCVRICVWDDTPPARTEDETADYRQRVRSLLGDLLLAEDRERKRLARDLHDGLSQTIALTQIKLSALRASQADSIDAPLEEIQTLMAHANRAARSIGFELCPMVLHDLGLEAALQWLTDNIHERYGITVDLECDGPVTPTDEITRVIFFRAIRELVINAAKHAGVRLMRVRIECREGVLHAVVGDDGVGIEPGAGSAAGFGLLNVRERMAHIGGQMTIDSARGEGTTVHLRAPLEAWEPRDTRAELR